MGSMTTALATLSTKKPLCQINRAIERDQHLESDNAWSLIKHSIPK
jgi:hypothetical protein